MPFGSGLQRGSKSIPRDESLGDIRRLDNRSPQERQEQIDKDIEAFLTTKRPDGGVGRIEKIALGEGAAKTKFNSEIVKAKI